MKKKLVFIAVLGVICSGFLFVFLMCPQVFYFESSPQSLEEVSINDMVEDKNQYYDLIVVGTDPEGIAAAVSGARNGLATLLVDYRSAPGGLITRGWLNTLDMNYGPGGEILNKGIFLEFYKQVGDISFDVKKAENVFIDMVNSEDKLDVMMSCQDIKPVVQRDGDYVTIKGIKISKDGKTVDINSYAVIDATRDADIAASAGAGYTMGHEDFGRSGEVMSATLVFRLEGINNLDWLKIYYHLNRDQDKNTGADYRSAWGFGSETAKYEPSSERIALRGLNAGRQDDYSLLINALQIFDVNPLDKSSINEARELAGRELPKIVDFLAKELPGFDNVKLLGTAPELYIRESRHIKGEYRLTVDDVLENRDFYDRVAFGSYPVDIQAASPGNKGYVLGKPVQYAVPFRCLIPQKIKNLLVVGRSASYDSLAAGSARTIPVGMAVGQSAAVATAVALEKGLSFRELALPLHIKDVQKRLNNQGVELKPFDIQPPPVVNHWAYSGLKFMRRLGLAAGGYDNNYYLDEEMSEDKFINCLAWAVRQTKGIEVENSCFTREGNELTVYDAAYMFSRCLQVDNNTKNDAYDYFVNEGFWDDMLLKRISRNNNIITNGMGYMLIKNFLEKSAVEDGNLVARGI